MHRSGSLTDEEYKAAKARVIGGMATNAAAPVVTAVTVPMDAAAPVPMMMSAGGGGHKIYALKIDSGGGCQDNTPPADVPPLLAMKGVSASDWGTIKQHIQEHRATNGYKNCAFMDAVCFCTCFGCCVCMPVHAMIGKHTARFELMKERRIPEINEKLAPYGIYAEFKTGMSGEYLGEYIVFFAN